MKKGFTLIELLLVISVIAVISIVVLLILNPAEIFKQSRDAGRVYDVNSLVKVLGIYQAEVGDISLGAVSTTYISVFDPVATSSAGDQCQGIGMPALPAGWTYHCASSSTYLNVDGTGWIPVDLRNMAGGPALSKLPRDPINNSSSYLYYTYQTNGRTFELSSSLESSKYMALSLSDGGLFNDLYEKGSTLGLLAMDFAPPASSGSSSWPNGYAYRRTITIDHTKVSSTDQTSFPMLFSGTYAYLAATSSAGSVMNSSGYDVIFTSDANGTSKLNFEKESYSSSTGAVNYWINVPTLSHSADTAIYLFYNATTTSDQSNRPGTWNSNYGGVWHLPNGTSLTANDSTANGNNGTLVNVPTAIAAKIYGGANFVAASTQQINLAAGGGLNNQQNGTMEAWVKWSGTQTAGYSAQGYGYIFGHQKDGQWSDLFVALDGSNPATAKIRFYPYNYGQSAGDAVSAAAVGDGTWHSVAVTYASGTQVLYVDGAVSGVGTVAGFVNNDAAIPLAIGSLGTVSTNGYINGIIDEAKTSIVIRSGGWIATEYYNQSSPSTFYTIGSETTP